MQIYCERPARERNAIQAAGTLTARKQPERTEGKSGSVTRTTGSIAAICQDPTEKCNDFKYSKRKVEQLAKSPDGGLEEFKKIYSDYDIVSCEPVFYEQTGWHIYLKMWKKKPKKGRKEDKKSS